MKKDTRNKYHQQGHISDLLWHFIGPKEFEDFHYDKAIERLLSYIAEDSKSINLAPYTQNGKFYLRTLFLPSSGFGTMSEATDVNTYSVEEPKSLCFCDIPINSLPTHIAKYGDIGIGIRRNRVVEGSLFSQIRPVLYYPHINEDILNDDYNNGRFWTVNGKAITLENFVKIPTKLSEQRMATPDHHSEDFESIYEEREWRTTESLQLTTKDVAYVIIPDETYFQKHEKLQKLILNGVGLIKAKDLYRTVKS